MSRDITGGRCRLTDSFPSAPPGGLGSSNRVGPGNNHSVVSERGDTATLIDQGRFTKDELITSYSTADRKTITAHFALKRMSTYSTSSYIGAILCPIFGIFAVKNSLKVNLG